MRMTRGTLPLLSELTDDEIAAGARDAPRHGWAVAVECSDDRHPRNVDWKMPGLPLFDAPVTELRGRDEGAVRC